MTKFSGCMMFKLIVLLVLFYETEAFTQLHQAKLNEVGVNVCEYEGFRWLEGKVEFLDECMSCTCDGGALFQCASTSFYYTDYPDYCKVIDVGCAPMLVMADNQTQKCVLKGLDFISIVGK